eukprot:TRINITY_DN44292_c0_g1_i1.p1 TRINITY_DN44292_c0_g1~~TRINITY_DN44292_c0_g1_i1.p1  ORF type:complete len:1054 (+),score=188.40 TRINITY_DN44292_c0_g1_i1:78-3239(+)
MNTSFFLAPQDECQTQCEELERSLQDAETKWCQVEATFEDTEEATLRTYFSKFQEWLGLEGELLSTWGEGGLRWKVRDRVQRYVLVPLCDRLSSYLELEKPSQVEETDNPTWALDMVFRHWEQKTGPLFRSALEADKELNKTIKKTEREERKQGVVALGMQDTKRVSALKRQRPRIWDPVREDVIGLSKVVKQLTAFLEAEASSQALVFFASSVPAIVGRAVCDWVFGKCWAYVDRIDAWWQATRGEIERRKELWRRLQDKEGVFVRKIENGLAELRDARQRYTSLATFGATAVIPTNLNVVREWPENAVWFLARSISETLARVRMIRDAAAPRVVDTAREILKELCDSEQPWWKITRDEGVQAILSASGVPTPSLVPGTETGVADVTDEAVDALEATMVIMQRLESLARASSELIDYWKQQRKLDTQTICGVLDEVVQAIASVNEDLLEVMDDPSATNVQSWISSWHRWGSAAKSRQLGAGLAALPLLPDRRIVAKDSQERRLRLSLSKGMQILLSGDMGLRARVVMPLAKAVEVSAVPSSFSAQPPPPPPVRAPTAPPPLASASSLGLEATLASPECESDDAFASLALTKPPSMIPAALVSSPRCGYVPRKGKTTSMRAPQVPGAHDGGEADVVASASTPWVVDKLPNSYSPATRRTTPSPARPPADSSPIPAVEVDLGVACTAPCVIGAAAATSAALVQANSFALLTSPVDEESGKAAPGSSTLEACPGDAAVARGEQQITRDDSLLQAEGTVATDTLLGREASAPSLLGDGVGNAVSTARVILASGSSAEAVEFAIVTGTTNAAATASVAATSHAGTEAAVNCPPSSPSPSVCKSAALEEIATITAAAPVGAMSTSARRPPPPPPLRSTSKGARPGAAAAGVVGGGCTSKQQTSSMLETSQPPAPQTPTAPRGSQGPPRPPSASRRPASRVSASASPAPAPRASRAKAGKIPPPEAKGELGDTWTAVAPCNGGNSCGKVVDQSRTQECSSEHDALSCAEAPTTSSTVCNKTEFKPKASIGSLAKAPSAMPKSVRPRPSACTPRKAPTVL